MTVKKIILTGLEKSGYYVARDPLREALKLARVNRVIDVGANVGQYALGLRRVYSYEDEILSIEPLESAFKQLEHYSARDPKWTAYRHALGPENSSAQLNISSNSVSSSFYDILECHTAAAPDSACCGKETVRVVTLDSFLCEVETQPDTRTLLKLDTQGFELQILAGANKSLKSIAVIQAELSFTQLYKEAPLAEDVISYLRKQGFVPYGLKPGFKDPASQAVYQADCWFFNTNILVHPGSLWVG